MPKPDKKQRDKKKREAKRLALRKINSTSPAKRLAQSNGTVQCWQSTEFDKFGQMQIFVHKQIAGLSGMACFLVDRGIAGLKDAWVKIGVTTFEFSKYVDQASQRTSQMERVSIDEARKWIAGAARWAHDNSMRLPADWLKTVSIIGGPGAWKTADVSAFDMEFAGHEKDLRQRLIGTRFEDFIQRKDVQFILSDIALYMDQETAEYLDDDEDDYDEDFDEDEASETLDAIDEVGQRVSEALRAPIEQLYSDVLNWLIAKHEMPSSELNNAAKAVLMASVIGRLSNPTWSTEELDKNRRESMDFLAQGLEGRTREPFLLAVTQVFRYLAENPLAIQDQIDVAPAEAKNLD